VDKGRCIYVWYDEYFDRKMYSYWDFFLSLNETKKNNIVITYMYVATVPSILASINAARKETEKREMTD
jgi:hypothetical protein